MLNGMLKENKKYILEKVERNNRVAIYCSVSAMHNLQEESLELKIESMKHIAENNPKRQLFKIYTQKDSWVVTHVWSLRKCYFIVMIIYLISS